MNHLGKKEETALLFHTRDKSDSWWITNIDTSVKQKFLDNAQRHPFDPEVKKISFKQHGQTQLH